MGYFYIYIGSVSLFTACEGGGGRMATTTKKRMSNLLLGNRQRVQGAVMFICLAAFVVLSVVAPLRQRDVAANTTKQVLDCHVTGVVVHTHNESCYDEDGELVCTLPELDLHTRYDSYYTEERTLVCITKRC